MSHRITLAAVLLTAIAVPAAAQSTSTQPSTGQSTTTPSDTSRRGSTAGTSNGATTSTSNGSVTEPSATGTNGSSAAGATGSSSSGMGTSSSGGASVGAAASVAPPPAAPVTGDVHPSEAARVNVKVAQSLASTVKISGDSAFQIARASASKADSGEVSSADLEMKSGRLVYQVKMLLKNKGASEVVVDAMTGEVLKDKRYGGAKALVEHNDENRKLLDAKRDSSGTKKP